MLLFAQLLTTKTTNLLGENRMTIKKIVLSTAAFGFAACNTLAMEDREKLITSQKRIEFFLVRRSGGVGYGGGYVPANLLRPSIRQHIPTPFRFGDKFAIEKALTENNFVPCTFSCGREAIVCNTTDKERCKDAETLMAIREILSRMPDPERPCKCCKDY